MEEQLNETSQPVVEEVRGFASTVHAQQVNFDSGFTFGASANQNLAMNRSLAVGAAAGGSMIVSDSFVVSAAVGHDVNFTDGVAGMVQTAGDVNITDGASVITIASQVIAQKTGMGVVIANQVNLEGDSSAAVSLTIKQALAFGAAFGAVFALLSRLLRRR